MAKQLKTSYEINWKFMPFLGEVSGGIFIDSCLYITGKNEITFTLFKINLLTYMQIDMQNLLTVIGILKDTAEHVPTQLGGRRIG